MIILKKIPKQSKKNLSERKENFNLFILQYLLH
ncbi:CLUMA_CG017464, isoform A [Clunio marinus]|uniref:CLUMA_CG017464, isoform A n=1 Tax=Clunio marinus TaxID=568069 RepID=A0A1J1IXS6_9DIPT|nr:CLUMA_CG017464, isoform A [Clunio marinus]